MGLFDKSPERLGKNPPGVDEQSLLKDKGDNLYETWARCSENVRRTAHL